MLKEDSMAESTCVMLTTAGSQEEADRLAEILVTRRLAACVQITPITSWYTWQGKVNHEPEYLLLIKTAAHLYPDVESALLANHSYAIPEIIQLPITQGLDSYLGWIWENTQP
jgi:periplasmic divalent cation tolerance protein